MKTKLELKAENETGIWSRKRKWSCYVNSTMRVNSNTKKTENETLQYLYVNSNRPIPKTLAAGLTKGH